MVGTVISLSLDDKAWLDRRAGDEGTAMTEIVRRSVRVYARLRPRRCHLVTLDVQQASGYRLTSRSVRRRSS